MQIEQLSNEITEFIKLTDKVYIPINKIDKIELNKRSKELFNIRMKYHTIYTDNLIKPYLTFIKNNKIM